MGVTWDEVSIKILTILALTEKIGYTTKDIAITIELGKATDLGAIELEKVV